jgi:hypothetical protein
VLRTEFEIGDIIKSKNTKRVGFITEVYNSKVKVTYGVAWFDEHNKPRQALAIEGYYLEKVQESVFNRTNC